MKPLHVRRQQGFTIISAVFLIVILALLGAMMVSMSTSQQVGSARDLIGSRAYFAAKTGIEWGAYQVLQAGSCNASTALPPATLANFTVTVTCARSGPFDEAGTTVNVYQLNSTATTGTPGAADYAERQLQAVVSTP
jgi:MSHA biogenesis protein MshP